jgi:hypothetical protein
MKPCGIILSLVGVLFFSSLFASAEGPVRSFEQEIWEVHGPADKLTWLIIHNLEEAKQTGLFHIEVVARKKNAPKWAVEHVCNHLAITAEALERSVIRPLSSGKVYPESFDSAYAEWRKKAESGEKVICTTSLEDCLKGLLSKHRSGIAVAKAPALTVSCAAPTSRT